MIPRNNGDTHGLPRQARFTTVWQDFREISPTNRFLGPSKTISFPYMLEGEACAALSTGKRIALGPVELMRGILMGYLDCSAVVDVSQVHLRDALEDLVILLSAPSLEILLLDGAAYMREQYGIGPGRSALQTAMAILPQSSLMKCDFIMATWSEMMDLLGTHGGTPDSYRQFCSDIATAYDGIDFDVPDPQALELLVYAQLVALSYLGRRRQRDEVVAHDAVKYIHTPYVSQRVQHILALDTIDLYEAVR